MAQVFVMYTDGESNENIWWYAEVAEVDPDTSDTNEPDFFVIYVKVKKLKKGSRRSKNTI